MNNLKYDRAVIQNKDLENDKFGNYFLSSNLERRACFSTSPGMTVSRGGLYDVNAESELRGQNLIASKFHKNTPPQPVSQNGITKLAACDKSFTMEETRRQNGGDKLVSDIQVRRFETLQYPAEYQTVASYMFPIGLSSREFVKKTYSSNP